jgi:hypothetical protein
MLSAIQDEQRIKIHNAIAKAARLLRASNEFLALLMDRERFLNSLISSNQELIAIERKLETNCPGLLHRVEHEKLKFLFARTKRGRKRYAFITKVESLIAKGNKRREATQMAYGNEWEKLPFKERRAINERTRKALWGRRFRKRSKSATNTHKKSRRPCKHMSVSEKACCKPFSSDSLSKMRWSA